MIYHPSLAAQGNYRDAIPAPDWGLAHPKKSVQGSIPGGAVALLSTAHGLPLGYSPMLLVLHKPYDVLSQFTQEVPGQRTLAEFGLPREVYPIGRLDRDSEGLLLLTNERPLVDRLLNPRHGHPRTYHVLVERVPEEAALVQLRRGVPLDGKPTLPCQVRLLEPEPDYAARVPPVRVRKNVVDCWIELILMEGRNRQVRRMTAAVGHPTLRLVRTAVGRFSAPDLEAGEWRELTREDRELVFQIR